MFNKIIRKSGKFFLISVLFSSFLYAQNFYIEGVKNFARGMQLRQYAPQQSQESFKKAAENLKKFIKENPNSSQAFFYLGRMYFNGWGVPQNYKKAFFYFEKAYNNGVRKALCNLVIVAYKLQDKEHLSKYYNLLQKDAFMLNLCKKEPVFEEIEKSLKENK